MPYIDLTDPVNGTPADADLIANNNQLLENLLNGNLDETNISADGLQITIYEQTFEPEESAPLGAIWVDTDELPAVGIGKQPLHYADLSGHS